MLYSLRKLNALVTKHIAVLIFVLMPSLVFSCCSQEQPGSSHLTVIDATNGVVLWSREFPVSYLEASAGDTEDVLEVKYGDQCPGVNKSVTFAMFSGKKLKETSLSQEPSWEVSDRVYPGNCSTIPGFVLFSLEDAELYRICRYESERSSAVLSNHELLLAREDTGAVMIRRVIEQRTEIRFIDEHLLLIEYGNDMEVVPFMTLEWVSLDDGQTDWTWSNAGSSLYILGSYEEYLHVWHVVGEGFLDENGVITAIDENDGEVVWRRDTPCLQANVVGAVVTCLIQTRPSECEYD